MRSWALYLSKAKEHAQRPLRARACIEEKGTVEAQAVLSYHQLLFLGARSLPYQSWMSERQFCQDRDRGHCRYRCIPRIDTVKVQCMYIFSVFPIPFFPGIKKFNSMFVFHMKNANNIRTFRTLWHNPPSTNYWTMSILHDSFFKWLGIFCGT